MAQSLTYGQEAEVTLAETVTELARADGSSIRTIIVWESDVAVHIVVAPTATDGGALPSSGRPLVAVAALPLEYDVSHASFVGVAAAAGTGGGTARIELR